MPRNEEKDYKLVVVFGTRLDADRWARDNFFNVGNVILANQPERLRGFRGPLKVVRIKGKESRLMLSDSKVKNTIAEIDKIKKFGGRVYDE